MEDQTILEMDIIQRASNCISDYKQANTQAPPSMARTGYDPRSQHRPAKNTKWKRPNLGLVKVNTDANLQNHGKWGLGIIIRDEVGLVMAASTWETDGNDRALEAEAYALLTGMRFAKDCGFRKVVFEGDNEKLMKMVREDYVQNRSYLGLML